MTRILITGSRSFTNYGVFSELLKTYLKEEDILLPHIKIIHGGAPGTDRMASRFCRNNDVDEIVVRPINPSRREYYLHRNAEMIGMADRVIGFTVDNSRGTKFTTDYAQTRGLNVKIFEVN